MRSVNTCKLPFSLLVMKQMQGGLTSSLRLILAALLPPNSTIDEIVINSIKSAYSAHKLSLLEDDSLAKTPESLFPLLREAEVLLVVKRCMRTGPINDEALVLKNIDINKFCDLLGHVSPEKVRVLHAYIIRIRALAKATKLPLCFKENRSLLKGNAIRALTKFSSNAIKILGYVGSFHDDQITLDAVDATMDIRLDEEAPTVPPRFPADAGSASAMFILGPFAMSPDNRKSIGCIQVEKDVITVLRLPKHGDAGFTFVLHENNAAAADEVVFD